MLIAMFGIALVVEIILPLVYGWWLIRRLKSSWKDFGIGTLTFLGSQVIHIPLVMGITALFSNGILQPFPPALSPYLNGLLLGLLAGLCEETARYIGLRKRMDRGGGWSTALTQGAGHGGIESIVFIGGAVLTSLISMLVLSSTDLTSLGITGDLAVQTQQQIDAFWGMAWYTPLLGAVERIMTVIFHTAASVMVMLAVTRRSWKWLVGAILYHTLVDGVIVASSRLGATPLVTELILVGFTVINLVWIFQSRKWFTPPAAPQETAPVIEAQAQS